MREMKDSGIPWIGEIPSDWKILRLKQLLANGKDAIKVGPFGSQLSGSDFTNDGFWVYNQQTVINHDFSKNDTFINHEKFNAMKSFQVRASDILITTRGTIGKICRIPKNFHEGIIHPCIIKFRIDDTKILYNIIEMLFNNSDLVKNQLNYMSNATTIDVIYSSTLKNIYIPVAPIKVQRRIADYLDTKCARIDSIRKNVEAEIEALKQYKKSVITEAVTKGLNKNVEMKDSGIPWIGEIPKNWKTGKIKYIADYSLNYPIGDGDHGLIKSSDYQIEGIPYIRVLNLTWGFGLDLTNIVYISEKQNRSIQGSQLKPDDILIAKTGATIGKTAIVPATLPISNTTSHVGKISVSKEHCAMYFYYQMNSSIVQKQVYDISSMQSTRPELGIEGLKNLAIVIPPKLEQEKISAYIQDEVIRINLIIKQKKGVLTNLDSYKKSLIYEYVTGKKEVPTV